MAQSVPRGLLASLHADRLLRGERNAKTAPLSMSPADHEVSAVAMNQASPVEVKPLTKQASLLSFFQKESPAPTAGPPSQGRQSWSYTPVCKCSLGGQRSFPTRTTVLGTPNVTLKPRGIKFWPKIINDLASNNCENWPSRVKFRNYLGVKT